MEACKRKTLFENDRGDALLKLSVNLMISALISVVMLQGVRAIYEQSRVLAFASQLTHLQKVLSDAYVVECPLGPTACPSSVWPTSWNAIATMKLIGANNPMVSAYDGVSPLTLTANNQNTWSFSVAIPKPELGNILAKSVPHATFNGSVLTVYSTPHLLAAGQKWGIWGDIALGKMPPNM